jgi:8-oxo-dGTP pyrophosphatase MutT (NUDIX family)
VIECIATKLLPTAEALELHAQGRNAAVLIPFRPQPDGSIKLVFTKRHDDLPQHAGQISFPGGRADPEDSDFVATALRESWEELAIPIDAVEVLGALEPMSTYVTDYAVYPIIGRVDAELPLTPNPGEVDSVFEVDLNDLAQMREKRELVRAGMTFTTEAFESEGGLIWGVTGYILGRLLDRIDGCLA